MRITADGVLRVVDPGINDLELLRAVDPGFTIATEPLSGFVRPRFQVLRSWQVPVLTDEIKTMKLKRLVEIHRTEMRKIKRYYFEASQSLPHNYVTMLDLKIELARRQLQKCMLCGRRCGVNRLAGEKGVCGLNAEASVAGSFVHIAEEAPINPSLLIELYGCGMRCVYCQKKELCTPRQKQKLTPALWHGSAHEAVRSLSFIGGNPDESLYAILQFLNTAPDDFCLPVVWNCSGYGTAAVYNLLDGAVDVYVPDVKYGNNKCAEALSHSPHHVETVLSCLPEMISQRVPVYVRMLILPGHCECCHIPALHSLKKYKDKIVLNIMDQFYEDADAARLHGFKASCPDDTEIRSVTDTAQKLGFHLLRRREPI